MADRKSKSRRKGNEFKDSPSKEEYAVAKFLRFNVPVREGKLVGMTVQCFYANKAIDALLESKWSASKAKKDPLFTNRASCVYYCHRLLQKGLFHRAQKVLRVKDRDKAKKKKKLKEGEKEEESTEETVRERKKKEKKAKKDGEAEKVEEEEKEKEKGEADKKDEKKSDKDEEKKKKKVRLDMSDDQRFLDGEEIYVWIYDPVPLKTFLIGLLMVLGAIALCLFPLWPEEVRVGVYYLSLAAAGFVGFILFLVVVRFVLFCLVWLLTLGKHHFWFLPNLTEDVGFFDSFKPLYKHELRDKNTKDKVKDIKDGKEKKEKVEEEGGKGDQKSEQIDKEENSASENEEFELVEKEDVGEEMEENDGEVDEKEEELDDNEEHDEDVDDDDDDDDDDNDDEEVSEDNTEPKKEK